MRSRAPLLMAFSGLFCVLTLSGCHSVFGLDDYELVPESNGAAGGLGNGGGGVGGGVTGGRGQGANGGAGGELVAVDDCCIDDAGPPEGWEYAIVSRQPGGQDTPTCAGSGSAPSKVLLSGEPGPAECGNACVCGNAEGGACSQELACFTDDACLNGFFSIDTLGCGGTLPIGSCRLNPSVVQGECPPSANSEAVPTWEFKHIACPDEPMDVEDECPADQHCALGAPGAQVCIWQAGSAQCPFEGDFTVAIPVTDDAGIVDTRSCEGCSCGPANTQCSVGEFFYGGISCSNTISTPGCTPTGGSVTVGIKTPTTLQSQGACTPSGTPSTSGDITGQTPYTLCCRGAFE